MPSQNAGALRARVADPAALLTLWALGPWAWAAQGAAMMGMLGLSAIALSVGRRLDRDSAVSAAAVARRP